jgi:hypothetical protein
MTDRPSPEQQLADVIRTAARGGATWDELGAAIVAAVNSGDIDPIVPDKGAWLTFIPAAEIVELRALKAKVDGWERNPMHGNTTRYRDNEDGWAQCIDWLRGTQR